MQIAPGLAGSGRGCLEKGDGMDAQNPAGSANLSDAFGAITSKRPSAPAIPKLLIQMQPEDVFTGMTV